MNSKQVKWSTAQRLERSYYETRAQSLSEEAKDITYATIHERFWKGILAQLPELAFSNDGCYYDVGCGPNSVLSVLHEGTRIGVDPLMDFYKANFVLPVGIEFHQDRIEELNALSDNRGDIIFIMNCIDHVEDIRQAVQTLVRKIKPEGHLVISVNIVRSKLVHFVLHRLNLYKRLDPLHPHHFCSPHQLAKQLAPAFHLVKSLNIASVAGQLAEEKKKYDKALHQTEATSKKGFRLIREKLGLQLREDLFLLLLQKQPT